MATIRPHQPKNLKHAFGSFPRSRATRCYEQQLGGPLAREPQPVAGPAGFPQAGPPDEQLASAGVRRFAVLDDVRGPDGGAWKAERIVRNQLTVWNWWLPQPSEASLLQYWVTVDDWNPDLLLSRDMFESEPFLTVQWSHLAPVQAISHWGRTPDKVGRHVIYGVWTALGSTTAFYQTVDVDLRDPI